MEVNKTGGARGSSEPPEGSSASERLLELGVGELNRVPSDSGAGSTPGALTGLPIGALHQNAVVRFLLGALPPV